MGVEDQLRDIFDSAIEKVIASVRPERIDQVLADRPNLFEDTMPRVVAEIASTLVEGLKAGRARDA
jgi:hypothetical protein